MLVYQRVSTNYIIIVGWYRSKTLMIKVSISPGYQPTFEYFVRESETCWHWQLAQLARRGKGTQRLWDPWSLYLMICHSNVEELRYEPSKACRFWGVKMCLWPMSFILYYIIYIYINLLNTTIPLICNLVIIDSNYTINEYPITTYLLTYILYSHVINVPWVFHPVLGGQRSGCWGVLRSDLGYSGPAFSVQVKIWSFPKSCGGSHPTNWW
jgi:hypothetical protein